MTGAEVTMTGKPWSEDLGTGVESMDAEHRLQVSLVNALEELLRKGGDQALATRTLAQLVDFSRVHFLSEELMMRLYAYPQHDAHKLEHGRLTDQVSDLQRRFEQGETQAALALADGLHRWLAGHIRTMDRAFAMWCASNGIDAR
jgi:hemerythrin